MLPAMCGRYVLPDRDDVEEIGPLPIPAACAGNLPHFNVAPTTPVPILRTALGGHLEWVCARWGLIPSWWRREKPPSMTFNARSEEARSKPVWRDSLRARRGLMPARGWYEWNENELIRTPSGRPGHQPYFLFCPAAKVIVFAAMWSLWQPEEAEPVLSCALLSTSAAPSIQRIHHRMPVVLRPEHQARWLDPTTPETEIQDLIAQARDNLDSYPVSPRVNLVRHNFPDLIVPAAPLGSALES